MLLAHIDVVEAKREDWERDPFTLVEEDGFFYARGASDDKAMAAVFTDILVRFQREGFKPRRGVKLALTCGEETPSTFNGVDWLLKTRPDVLKAKFVLNEGAGGLLDADGKHLALDVQAGEKVYQDFALETTNPGGHSAGRSGTTRSTSLRPASRGWPGTSSRSPGIRRRAPTSRPRQAWLPRRSPATSGPCLRTRRMWRRRIACGPPIRAGTA